MRGAMKLISDSTAGERIDTRSSDRDQARRRPERVRAAAATEERLRTMTEWKADRGWRLRNLHSQGQRCAGYESGCG